MAHSRVRHECFNPHEGFLAFKKQDIDQSLASRFEQQVKTHADELAVKTPHELLTYDSLNHSANRIAHGILARRGEGAEPVAFIVDKGVQQIATILGIMKAGKICVPIDPSFPEARAEFMLANSQAPLLLISSKNRRRFNGWDRSDMEIVELEQVERENSSANPKIPVSPRDLAWILYTSGSTGQPKGVTQNHRNFLFEVMRLTNAFQISAQDRVTNFLSCSVIGGMREIFAALLNGASLYPMDLREESPASIENWLLSEELTVCRLVGSTFRNLVSQFTSGSKFTALRLIYVGGDSLYRSDLELFRKTFSPKSVFVNVYGATETGLVRHYFMDHDTPLSGNVPPIGYPVDEMEVVLLDDERKPVETGETGEIAVRSRYLSPGYWNMNDLTARAFLPDPIDGKSRIYLTGDLGRMKQDGCLEHLGRKDSQVKIRGFRTELQEIEALLDQHQGIVENFVTTTIDDHGENRLVAYVVPKAGQALSQSELRAFLKEKLPDHMVPSIVQFMDVLPRTPNGKVDRQSLPRTVKRHRVLEQATVPPKDGLELELSTIWEHVLDIQPVGVDDNFFDLGGHSLQAVRIIGAIERRLGKKLAPAVLFQAPTVKQLASLLREARWNTAQPSILPLQTAGYKRPLYWIHGDSTNAFLPDFLGTDQPLYGLEHQSQDGVPAVYTTVESIATYYLNQILTLQPQGPYRLGGYSFGGTVAFEIAQRLARQKQEVVLLFMLDSLFPQSAAISDTASSSAVRAITPYMRIAQEQLRHLSRLKTHEKLTYIVMKVASKLRDRAAVPVRKAARIFKTAACRYHLWKKHGIPPSLRSFYILKIYQRALRNYSPQRYDGHAIYIKSSERSRQNAQDWAGVIAGGLEVYEVPGDHMTIIKQPIARLWAEKLKSHLARIDVVT